MTNGLKIIKPFNTVPTLTRTDILLGLFDACGAKVSSMPRNYTSMSYSDKWEFLDPEQVKDESMLPEYWRKILALHNASDRKDCVTLRYRYIHVPVEILPQYPRVLCKGIFVITDRSKEIEDLTPDDLIHIGNEIEEG